MRRNLLIANRLKSEYPHASVLLIAGAREICSFAANSEVACLSLPAYYKNPDGSYSAQAIGLSRDQLVELRSQSILGAIRSYQPDILIADKLPGGALGELVPALDWLNHQGTCRCVLGLRDILDTPQQVAIDWQQGNFCETIREYYDSVWVYGDDQIFDTLHAYQFPPDIAQRVQFTGYLDARERVCQETPLAWNLPSNFSLCTVGGGQDGGFLASHFVKAIRNSSHFGVVLAGPKMAVDSFDRLRALADQCDRVKLIRFAPEGDLLIQAASSVVAMGGYNTLTAILTHQKRALIVPRTSPRQEQLIRAQCFADRGLVSTIHPDHITPESINGWLAEPAQQLPDYNCVNLSGLQTISRLVHSLLPAAKIVP